MEAVNYYEILGIEHSATAEEIKAAYRQLAKKYHPDANDAQNANTFFRLIHEAYAVLSDTDKRKAYDDRDVLKHDYSEDNAYADASAQAERNYGGDISRDFVRRRKIGPLTIIAAILKIAVKIIFLPLIPVFLIFGRFISIVSGIADFVLTLLTFVSAIGFIAGLYQFLTGSADAALALAMMVAGLILSALSICVKLVPDLILSTAKRMINFVKS